MERGLAVPPGVQVEKANWVFTLKGPCGVENCKVCEELAVQVESYIEEKFFGTSQKLLGPSTSTPRFELKELGVTSIV